MAKSADLAAEHVAWLAGDNRADDRAHQRDGHRESEAAGAQAETRSSAPVVPEITAVSKPNSRPPNAAMIVLRRTGAGAFILTSSFREPFHADVLELHRHRRAAVEL